MSAKLVQLHVHPLSMTSLIKYPLGFDKNLRKSSTGVDTVIISINLSFNSFFSNLHFVTFYGVLIQSRLYFPRLSGAYVQNPEDGRENLS